jgi:lipid-A-disaccharide synthase
MTTKKILIFTGEHSGERLGAELIKAAKASDLPVHFYAMGGDILKNAGADIVLPNQGLDIIGFFEVFKHLPKLFNLWQQIKKTILDLKPDLIIFIDNPGLNLKIAKFAKQQNIKVLYYVSPQIWAWKAGRIKRIQHDVDHMALLFPFEKNIYDQASMASTVVGHPMLNRFIVLETKQSARQQLNLSKDRQILAILPGSRPSEIKRLMPVILEAARKIHQADPNIQMIIAQADSIDDLQIPPDQTSYLSAIKHKTDNIVAASDAVICASGTATLEVALAQRPLVIIYKTSSATYQLAKRLIKTPYIGLCNVVAQKEIAKELIQDQANPENIAEEALNLLKNIDYKAEIDQELSQIQSKLGHKHQPEKLIKVIGQLLDN